MDAVEHCEHGVFLSVLDVGLLIKGDAGIGKSSLALELIERGHQFISDDVVHIFSDKMSNSTSNSRLIGKSPDMLKDLLAIRDLGVLNVAQLFSANSCLAQHPLDLIIELVDNEHLIPVTLTGIQSELSLLNHTIPVQTVHAHPKRNLAVIVETAVKNHILYKRGQDAGTLLEKQQQYI